LLADEGIELDIDGVSFWKALFDPASKGFVDII
jgi:hypothetical protein